MRRLTILAILAALTLATRIPAFAQIDLGASNQVQGTLGIGNGGLGRNTVCPAGETISSDGAVYNCAAVSANVNQAADYDWTGLHTFTGTPDGVAGSGIRPFELFSSASTRLAGTNEGLRRALASIYVTEGTDVNVAGLDINMIQTADPAPDLVKFTGIHIKQYSWDCALGGECSGILGVSTGGGPAGAFYKISETHRPAGFTNRASSPQPALEAATADQASAILAIAGAFASSNISQAINARVDGAAAKGILISPGNGVYDTRKALQIGSMQINAPNVNVKFDMQFDGRTAWSFPSSGVVVENLAMSLARSSSDQGGWITNVEKNRAGGPALAGDVVHDDVRFIKNSVSATVEVGRFRWLADAATSGAESGSLRIHARRAGVTAERVRVDGRLKLTNSDLVYADQASAASTASLTLPVGNLILVTGVSSITSISPCDATNNGRIAHLTFDGVLTVTDGGNLKLAGNFVTSADDVLTLVCNGSDWLEIARSVN